MNEIARPRMILSYLAAFAVGLLCIEIAQIALVVFGGTPVETLGLKNTLSNFGGVAAIYAVGYIVEYFGKFAGLKKWQGLTLLFLIAPIFIVAANIGQNPNLARIALGTMMACSVLGVMYLSSTFVGKKVYARLGTNPT